MNTCLIVILGEELSLATSSTVLTIYAPINLTAPCVIFSGAHFHYEEGMGPGTRDFFWASEIARAVRRVRFGAQKVESSRAQSSEY